MADLIEFLSLHKLPENRIAHNHAANNFPQENSTSVYRFNKFKQPNNHVLKKDCSLAKKTLFSQLANEKEAKILYCERRHC